MAQIGPRPCPSTHQACVDSFIAGACDIIPVNDYNLLRPHNHQPRVPYHHITCRKCTMHAVADEAHVLLHCPCTEACRQAFPSLTSPGGTLRAFLVMHHNNPHAPFFVHNCIQTYARAQVVVSLPPAQSHAPSPQTQHDSDHTDADSVVSADIHPSSPSHRNSSTDGDSSNTSGLTHTPRVRDDSDLMGPSVAARRHSSLDNDSDTHNIIYRLRSRTIRRRVLDG